MKARLVSFYGTPRIFVESLTIDVMKVVGPLRSVDTGGLLMEINAFNLRRLLRSGQVLSDELHEIYRRMFIRRKVKGLNIRTSVPLLRFQEEGVREIDRRRGVALLGDDMGLGKTPQTLAWVAARKKFPCIVICPAHLKYNWEKEIRKFVPWCESEVLSGLRPYVPTCEQFLIVNYDILKTWYGVLSGIKPRCVLADEAQHLKSKKSKRSMAGEEIITAAKYKILMTGTPMETRTSDLWNLWRLLDPYVFGNWTTFVTEFCNARKAYRFQRIGRRFRRIQYIDTSGVSNPKALHFFMHKTYLIRRTKEEVQQDLPEKVRTIIPVDVGKHAKGIRKLETRFVDATLEDEHSMDARSMFSTLRKESGMVKVASGVVYQWIDDYLEQNTKPLIVVCWHRAVVANVIYDHYRDIAVRITGAESAKQKQMAVEAIQGNKARMVVGNVKSIGTGHTLTAADTMLIVELPVNASDLDQVEDRIRRISQKAKTVNYHYLVIRDSIEHRLMELIDEKKGNESLVIDGRKVPVSTLLVPLVSPD